MTLDLGNTDKLNVFKQELDRLKIKLLPPDINRSRARVRAVRRAVRPTGHAFSGASATRWRRSRASASGAMEGLVAERGRRAVRSRTSSISPAGSMPSCSTSASWKTWSRPAPSMASTPTAARPSPPSRLILRHAQSAASERDSQQDSLFGDIDAGRRPRFALPVVADWPAHRAAAPRVRGHRLLSLGPSARRLRRVAAAARRRAASATAGLARRAGRTPAPSSPAWW